MHYTDTWTFNTYNKSILICEFFKLPKILSLNVNNKNLLTETNIKSFVVFSSVLFLKNILKYMKYVILINLYNAKLMMYNI